MKEFWNDRYSRNDFAYGEEPNEYFKEQLAKINPGRILLPADGEGRNGVFAAKKGWQVESIFNEGDFHVGEGDVVRFLGRKMT